MSNAASRILKVMQNTSESTNTRPSEIVTLIVKAINPIIFQRDDRLEIADTFCIYNKLVDKTALHVGDTVTAIVLNDGQQYYIAEDTKPLPTPITNYNELSNKPKIGNVELTGNKSLTDLGLNVINNLSSTSPSDVLAALQGKVLAEFAGNSEDTYDSTAIYEVGDITIYNNLLYVCTTAITIPEDFNINHWTKTNIKEITDKITLDNTKVKLSDSLFTAAQDVTLLINQSFRIGDMIFLNLKFNGNLSTSLTVYATIDSSIRPSVETTLQTSNAALVESQGWIRTNGEIAIEHASAEQGEDIRILSFYPI